MTEYFNSPKLVQDVPIMRAAYSDRTAWLMAEMSRLAYEPIPGAASIEDYVKELRVAIQKGNYEDKLTKLIKGSLSLSDKDYDLIERELKEIDFELIATFAQSESEAFLAKLNHPTHDPFLVLAFRGTESIKDAYTDAKAVLIDHPDGGRVHSGFYEAYGEISDQIEEALKEHHALPLYITGHSLGGALALLATKHIGHQSTGATYTFGAPRAADDAFFTGIKTPIYRVVNAADAVPRVPFGHGLNFVLAAIRLIPINYTKVISEQLRKYFSGYTHQGHLIFLNAPDEKHDENGIPYANLRVGASPNYFWRSSVVVRRLLKTGGKAAATDHFIAGYSEKLRANALRRR